MVCHMMHHMSQPTKPLRLPQIVANIYDLLEPLETSDRTRVLQGVLGLLGEPVVPVAPSITPPAGAGSPGGGRGRIKGLKAAAWMSKHGITEDQLERVFHLDGQVDVIATPPGNNKREQTINAYLLIGAQHLLQTDDSKFTETEAVALCKQMGCHDAANHAQTRSKFGNRITGSKDGGYSLTTPGLDRVAALIKTIGTASS